MLVQGLIQFGVAVGRGAYACVGATKHYLNENAIIVGSTNGGRKGMSGDNVQALFEVARRTPIAASKFRRVFGGEG
jgi:hypothetical protein